LRRGSPEVGKSLKKERKKCNFSGEVGKRELFPLFLKKGIFLPHQMGEEGVN
jgi:hypothetical protein